MKKDVRGNHVSSNIQIAGVPERENKENTEDSVIYKTVSNATYGEFRQQIV